MTNLKSAHQDPLAYSPEPVELLDRWVCGKEVVHHPWVALVCSFRDVGFASSLADQ